MPWINNLHVFGKVILCCLLITFMSAIVLKRYYGWVNNFVNCFLLDYIVLEDVLRVYIRGFLFTYECLCCE